LTVVVVWYTALQKKVNSDIIVESGGGKEHN
jgi:hypothetical protein